MNKKLFLGMFAAAGMLLATSCSNDELDAVQSGNEAQVTFSLGLEGGIATRAISDGTGAKKLVCAVYDANETLLDKVVINDKQVDANGQYVNTDAFKGGLKDNISITLAKGQTYTIAFWAQNGGCDAYDTDDLKAVKVDYTNGAEGTSATGDINNDDTRDAFFAAETFKVEGNKEIDVTLKRPFAQINVGVTAEDWEAAVASNIEIKQSAVVIKNVADEINLLTGAVNASDAMANGITYTLGNIPDETLYVETDATKEGKEAYVWLSMSYILVDDGSESVASVDGTQKSTLNGLKYTFAPETGNSIEFAEGLAGAPVQRNWRTNILGKILTGDIQFNITIDPVYDGDYIYPDGTAEQELEFATTFGGTYTLTEDLTIDYLEPKADFIFNIISDVTLTAGSATNYGIKVLNGTTTINSEGDIDSKGGGIAVANGAELVFNGGNLSVDTESTSGRYLFYLVGEGSTATINGGNFSWDPKDNQKRAYIYADKGTTVYVKGGTFGKASTRSGYTEGILGDGKVIITGGTFGFDPSKWVADGYAIIKKDNNFVVVPEIVASLANVTEETTVKLRNNVTVSTGTTIHTQNATANITINGNGKSIVSTAESAADFTWESGTIPAMSTILSSSNGSKVTVNDLSFSGTMSSLMLGNYVSGNSSVQSNFNTELNNVKVVNTKVVSFSANISPAVTIYGSANLNDCNIYGTTLSSLDTDPMWPVYDLAVCNYSETVLNGGKYGSIYSWEHAKITIESGTSVESITLKLHNTKGQITVKAGANVGYIDLSNATNVDKVNITIEDDATVGKFVDNGKEYSTLDDWKMAQQAN